MNTKIWRFTIRAIIGVAALTLTTIAVVNTVQSGAVSVSWFWALPTVAVITVALAAAVLYQAVREISHG